MADKDKKLKWHWRGSRPGQKLNFVLDDNKVSLEAPGVIHLSPGDVERANLMDLVERGTLSLDAGPPVRRSRHRDWDGVYNWKEPNQPTVDPISR